MTSSEVLVLMPTVYRGRATDSTAGSVPTSCDDCGQDCWVSPEGKAMGQVRRVCVPCAYENGMIEQAVAIRAAPGAVGAALRHVRGARN